jgi:septal ring factor EnvC (AmiA/AmiB activator)
MMSGLIDKLKKQMEKEVEERIRPIAKELEEIKEIQREQLKVLKEILRVLRREQDWTKLSLEELTQLATVLANPDSLCKRLCKDVRHLEDVRSAISEIKTILKEIKYEGPIIKLAKKLLGISTETPGGEEGGEAK